MKEKLLCDVIADVFKDAVLEIFKKEKENPKYMKQTIFGSRIRATIGILTAFKMSFGRIYKISALAIAKHRQEFHGDNNGKTISSLSRSMSVEDIESSTAAGGWSN